LGSWYVTNLRGEIGFLSWRFAQWQPLIEYIDLTFTNFKFIPTNMI
jgi:hypothetical protein